MTTAAAPPPGGLTPAGAAHALYLARRDGRRVPSALLQPASRGEAYAIQDATLAAIGPVGGWKVSALAPGHEPTCAPLPAEGLLPDGARLQGPAWRLRGIEAEIGFQLGTDLPPRAAPYTLADLARAVESVLPVIEIVETRLADWFGADAHAQLADLLSHGALVLGRRQPFAPAWFDLRRAEAALHFDGQTVAHTVGEHPSPDAGALLVWLANHCAARGAGLKAGQIVTSGSCTGMLFASAGTAVRVEIGELATVVVSF
ncbi:2-keto-4-pentenoate hydratase [Variovorax paradoxus]|uniref:2-keto-4-pentenoate hydratase n=1 Tax=Variovorax paradoxus TaxID=34073 RepID=UPI00277D6608|nr:fumarylacetoacetate hydrolase family protein [Variovorax paradoxus]MDQ0588551.1 2-keto-4-pentenoate hydratase [Variovorax paradoxus]